MSNALIPANYLDGARAWCHVCYALHALAVIIGVIGASSIAGAFVFGVPSLLAVILNYIKRDEVKGTWLEGHYRWQIRTFWITLAWLVAYGVLIISFIGIIIAWLLIAVLGVWVSYRVIRGWLALANRQPLSFAA